MFYSFLKVLVRFVLKLFFRKIHITGIEHVQISKAQLIASNHPNGFLEPLVMACFFPKPLHFLVRGDVFDNPILKPLLTATNQIPIFRFRDGFSKLRENSQTMDESIKVLLDKKNLLIFAEGGTQNIKKLRPLQKGISRIAFQALEKDANLDLEILPVGINFTYPTLFNRTVMLRVGAPIRVQDYLTKFTIDHKLTHQSLLDDTYRLMKNNIIHVEDQDRIHVFEKLVILLRSRFTLPYMPVFVNDNSSLDQEKELAEKVDAIDETSLINIKSEIKTLEQSLKMKKVDLHELAKQPLDFPRAIILILGFVPALLSLILNGLPMFLAKVFTTSKVKHPEFKASILMVGNLLLFIIYYMLLFIAAFVFGWSFWYVVVIILLAFWLRLYYEYYTTTSLKLGKKEISDFKNIGFNILNTL
jgi:1-acyl-sn-glycerol-3-phosphate acyltransferase